MTADRERRRELSDAYARRDKVAAVYQVRDRATGRTLLGSTVDLASVRNRFEFARSTGIATAIDGRLRTSMPGVALDDLELIVLDTLEPAPGATDQELRADLDALTDLWRDRLRDEPATED
ncbi:MAG: hypothetical protein U0869_20665 [Chloroflexota bacterium]